jgi:hypothetical protein
LFQSQVFILLFLPAVLGAYYLSAERPVLREAILILASLLFYAWWDARFVPLLVGQTVGTWLIAEGYLRFPSRAWIVFGIAANLAVLAFFKYLAFIAGTVVGLAGVPVQGWDLILPLGISFYTFELISYLVDLRRGDGPHYPLRKFCLFIFLFPHLIAGPIIRHNEIIPQFSLSPFRPGLAERFAKGIAFFVVGCVKKVFIADQLAGVADPIFAGAASPAFGDAWLGALAFPAVPRFLRLFGDGDRARADARLAVSRQLQRAVPGDQHPGVLAALAHDVVALLARLSLHPAGRQLERLRHLPQSVAHHHGPVRAVAWRGLHFHRLGASARRGAHRLPRLGGLGPSHLPGASPCCS